MDHLCKEFEKKLNNSIYNQKVDVITPSKEDIIQEIKRMIELNGYVIKRDDIQRFIENFIDVYDRLPKKDEYDSIVKGYMKMVNEDYLLENTKRFIKNEPLSERKESHVDSSGDDITSTSDENNIETLKNTGARRKCPNCGNEGLIHEMDDKSVIILDYPKIYGRKYVCGNCGAEWRN